MIKTITDCRRRLPGLRDLAVNFRHPEDVSGIEARCLESGKYFDVPNQLN